MNNNNRKDQKPNFGIAKLVIFGVSALFLFIDVIGTDGGSAFFIILMIGAVIAAAVAIKKQQADGRSSDDAESAAPGKARV